MRGLKGGGALVLAAGALLGVQAQAAQATLTPNQTRLEEDRKKLYHVEFEHDKDASKFVADEAKEAAKVGAKIAKDQAKAATDSKIASKIGDEVGKSGGTFTQAQLEHLAALQAAYEAKAKAAEGAAVALEFGEAKAKAKRHAVLVALQEQRLVLEAEILIDEEAVAAEGL